MSHGSRRSGLRQLVVAGCLVVCGCGDGDEATKPEAGQAPDTVAAPKAPPTLDEGKVESALEKSLSGIELPGVPTTIYPKGGGPPTQSQIGGGRLKVRSVSCPPDVPVEKGGTFTCDVDARKNSASVRVKQIDARGRRLSYTAKFKLEVEAGIPTVETNLHGRIKLK
jgi:hypothetical protein